jgi:hypothetical protein
MDCPVDFIGNRRPIHIIAQVRVREQGRDPFHPRTMGLAMIEELYDMMRELPTFDLSEIIDSMA